MRRVALVGYGELELQENYGDIKALESGTVKIDVTTCSVYGSDIALYRGERSLENERYFGYELSGMVMDPGDGADGIKKGMRMASEPSRACGRYWNCHDGLPNYCRSMNDALLPGRLSEETLVLDTQEYSFINPVPDAIDDITVTLLEPTNCACHVARQADMKHGETVVVFDMGPMGLIAPRIIKNMGIDVVVGVGNSKTRLERVWSLGFIEVINSNDGNWQGRIFEMCSSRGADVIIELTGALPVLQSAFRIAHPGGRVVAGDVYSNFTEQVELLPIIRKELTIRGSKGPYPHLKTDCISATVDILVRFQDDLEKLTTVYGYKDALKAFDDMISDLVIKPVIRFRS